MAVEFIEQSPFFFPEKRRLSGIELLFDNIVGIDNQYETVEIK